MFSLIKTAASLRGPLSLGIKITKFSLAIYTIGDDNSIRHELRQYKQWWLQNKKAMEASVLLSVLSELSVLFSHSYCGEVIVSMNSELQSNERLTIQHAALLGPQKVFNKLNRHSSWYTSGKEGLRMFQKQKNQPR